MSECAKICGLIFTELRNMLRGWGLGFGVGVVDLGEAPACFCYFEGSR